MRKIILVFVILFAIFSAKAEELITLGLFSLVYSSTNIFTARPIEGKEIRLPNSYSELRPFLVQNLVRGLGISSGDTVWVDTDNYAFVQFEEKKIDWQFFDGVIFYGNFYSPPSFSFKSAVFCPTISGIRPFSGEIAFTPIQSENPGPYYLGGKKGETMLEMVAKTKLVMARLDSILALRNDNQALFEWISAHKIALKQSDLSDFKDWKTNWGELQWEVFQWINGNGIWQDAWKSMLLSKEILSFGGTLSRPEDMQNAFLNNEARAFLMREIAQISGSRNEAIQVLSSSLWDWPSNQNSISLEEQTQIIQLAIPLLENDAMQFSALQLIQNSSFPPDYEWQWRRNVSALPFLKKALGKTTDEYFRKNLVSCIQRMEQK
jgi:hypothetical protein